MTHHNLITWRLIKPLREINAVLTRVILRVINSNNFYCFTFPSFFWKIYFLLSLEIKRISLKDLLYLDVWKAEWYNHQNYWGVWVVFTITIFLLIFFGGYTSLPCRLQFLMEIRCITLDFLSFIKMDF